MNSINALLRHSSLGSFENNSLFFLRVKYVSEVADGEQLHRHPLIKCAFFALSERVIVSA